MESLNSSERKKLYLRIGLRLFIFVVAITAISLLLPPLIRLFGPFILALFVAWIINPLVRVFNKRIGTSRRIVSLIIIVILTLAVAFLFAYVVYRIVTEIVDLAANWQSLWAGAEWAVSRLDVLTARLGDLLPPEAEQILQTLGDSISSWVQSTLSLASEKVLQYAPGFASSIASSAVSLVVFVMALYFITADYPRIKYLITGHMGDGTFSLLRTAASGAVGGYLKAQLILSSGVGVIIYIVLLVMGQNYALLIALGTAVIDFVPFFGSGIVLVPWAIFALIGGNRVLSLVLAGLALLLFLARKLAEPKIVGDQTGISPLVSLISMFAGMKLGGVLGMVLGPVVCMIFISVYHTGVFNNTINDIKLLYADIRNLLSGTKPDES